jgi:hypothetical protein
MFWLYALIVVVAFVAVIGWFGRARGTARGKSASDLTRASRQARWKSQGNVSNYDRG